MIFTEQNLSNELSNKLILDKLAVWVHDYNYKYTSTLMLYFFEEKYFSLRSRRNIIIY